MSKWSSIYSDVKISTGDGFYFIRLPYTFWVPAGEINPFVEMLGIKTDKQLSPQSAMQIYLCNTMISTFCFGKEFGDSRNSSFIIGVRDEKDLFQLKLRFANSVETRIRETGTKFYVRVRDGDHFSEDGTLKNDSGIGEAIQ